MINVLFSGNEKVFDGILSCIISIFKRTATKEPFTFYVYTMDVSHLNPNFTAISNELITYLDYVVKQYSPESKVLKTDVTKLYFENLDKNPNEGSVYSPYTLLRLFADLVPDMPDKLLYLDVDLLFNKDIMSLYSIDITNYEYAAARDHYGKMLRYPNHINAGVLLLNMVKIKENQTFLKSRNLLKVRKMLFPDQEALSISTTKKKMISQRFNDQRWLKKKTVIRHFSKRLYWLPYPHIENLKQWQVQRVHKVLKYYQFDDIYADYFYFKKKYEIEILKQVIF